MTGSVSRYLSRLPSVIVAPEDLAPHLTFDVVPMSPGDSLDEWIAGAERLRATLTVRVAEARARLTEAESRASVTPEVLHQLGTIVTEAQECVESERARADEIVAGIAAHAELKAMLLLAAAEDEAEDEDEVSVPRLLP